MDKGSGADWASVSIDPSALPKPMSTLYPAYGEGHNRPLLALTRPVGTFEVDLTTFREGMPVSCKYIDAKKRSYGWFPGIINRIVDNKADIEYDDGTYDYNVPFRHLQFVGKKSKRTFQVEPLPARNAIVLSIPHAREAVAEATRLVAAIEDELQFLQNQFHTAFSTPPKSMCSTPPPVLTTSCTSPSSPTCDDDDDVQFIMEKVGTSRGSEIRPIVL